MAMETNNTPALRFPGFAEEWEEKTLGEVCEIKRGKTFSKSDIDADGTELCIHYGELLTKYKESITEVYSRTFKTSGLRSKKGDVLMPSSAETPDALSKASALLLNNVILGSDMNILRTNDNTNAVFLSYVINNSEKIITRLVTGGTVFHLYAKQLNDLAFLLPSLPEQQKIAACLSSLDALITAAQERLDTLKAHKKGLLQRLFPCEGRKTPELRFAGFKGAWEEKTLGDIGEPLMCKRILKEKTTNCCSEGNVPFYKIGTFGQKADAYIPKIIYDEYKGKYSFPKKGEILISASGTIGRLVIYDGEPAYFQDSNIVWVANDQKALLNSFLYYIYTTLKWQTSDGGTINRLYNSDLKRMKVSYPSLPEQRKIASCLSSLDTLIEAQQERIALLKTHKKGLLQQLFPNY